jgi:hypothetical protein
MFPTLLLHQMVEFGSSIARMRRSRVVNLLGARLAPDMVATRNGTGKDSGILVLLAIHESFALASNHKFSTADEYVINERHVLSTMHEDRERNKLKFYENLVFILRQADGLGDDTADS